MPLNPSDDKFLAEAYRNLQEKPIEPGHRFYVEIWEGSDHDPVRRLGKHILWSEIQSLQLFSGFSGSGKSTQLRRLKQDLEDKGYRVVYANAEDYLNLGEPIGIEELLITIAGAFSDNLDSSLLKDSYWDRLMHYLTTEVKFGEVTLGIDKTSFKAELKSSPTFRQRVRTAIQSRIPQIRSQIEKFSEDAVKSVQERAPEQRVVFLFDSFEKLRGTPSNEREIIDSIEELFGRNLDLLGLPHVHCVYSVPAFVRFVSRSGELVLIPTIKLWNKRVNGQPEIACEEGRAIVRKIIGKRLGSDSFRRIFGEPDESGKCPQVERLIEASGGALRDLLRLFRETLLAATSLPVTDRTIEQAISIASDDFRTSIEDARWLQKIHEEQAADLPTTNAADVNRYMRLLDSHLILYYTNNTSWYDTHPLVRGEVERILALNPEISTPTV